MKLILITIYFIVTLAIGFHSYKKIKNGKDFYVAGKDAGVLSVAGSLLATTLGSSAIIGSINTAYNIGWAGSWLMICAAFGFFVLLFLVKYIKNFTGYNLPEMLGEFYGYEVKKISSIIISIAWVGVVASQLMGAANILTVLLGVTFTNGVVISGTIFTLYTMFGGQLSVLKTDFFQLIFIILGIILVYLFISGEPIMIQAPSFINSKFKYMDLFIMVLTYSTTFIVGPDIYSRLFCAKDEKTMKASIIISICVLIPLAFMFGKIGIYGMQVFQNVNLEGKSVLFVIASEKLSAFVSFGLYLGLLSAVISSADTTLITAASLLAQSFTKDMDSKNGILRTRLLMIVIGILAIIISIKMKHILPTLFMALTIYSGAFIIPTILGMIGFNPSKYITITAIITGGAVALFGKLYGGTNGNYIMILAFLLNGFIMFLGDRIKKVSTV
ncbi:MAG: sodium:solute symporter family protein [Fusobacteriaceae bacterium]|nr:sodium:solute symporter family protein [Fusobacteriaceae bacterium]